MMYAIAVLIGRDLFGANPKVNSGRVGGRGRSVSEPSAEHAAGALDRRAAVRCSSRSSRVRRILDVVRSRGFVASRARGFGLLV